MTTPCPSWENRTRHASSTQDLPTLCFYRWLARSLSQPMKVTKHALWGHAVFWKNSVGFIIDTDRNLRHVWWNRQPRYSRTVERKLGQTEFIGVGTVSRYSAELCYFIPYMDPSAVSRAGWKCSTCCGLVAKLESVGLGRQESESVCHLRLLTEVGSGRAYLSSQCWVSLGHMRFCLKKRFTHQSSWDTFLEDPWHPGRTLGSVLKGQNLQWELQPVNWGNWVQHSVSKDEVGGVKRISSRTIQNSLASADRGLIDYGVPIKWNWELIFIGRKVNVR